MGLKGETSEANDANDTSDTFEANETNETNETMPIENKVLVVLVVANKIYIIFDLSETFLFNL